MISSALDRDFDRTHQPYPAHLATSRRLPDGTDIVVRSIRPEDDQLERAFIDSLSSDTRYNRLLSGRKLTPEEIRHLTRIDYDREMAFVAVIVDGRQARLLGVARYVRDAGTAGAEFAIVVADAWQAKGIGSVLLGTLLQHAQSAGITLLRGVTLATNQAMQNLARRLGFAQRHDPLDATLPWVEISLAADVAPPPAALCTGHSATAAANDDRIAVHA